MGGAVQRAALLRVQKDAPSLQHTDGREETCKERAAWKRRA